MDNNDGPAQVDNKADRHAEKMAKKKFKHDTPLIKTDVKTLGKKELEKSAEMGPIPVEGDVVKLKKRRQLSSVKDRNYLLISEILHLLKWSSCHQHHLFSKKLQNFFLYL